MARILVVDDEKNIRKLLRSTLEREGYEVVDAANGTSAIELFRIRPADLIITDIIMPKKEGLEAILELRREFPEVKIFAISGGGWIGSKHYLDAAEQLGALRTFSKPIDSGELIAAVKEVVG